MRTLLIFLVVTIFVLIFLLTAASPSSLPDLVQVQILQLEAAGKFAEADSLKSQAEAAVKLAARQAQAQKKLKVIWGREVSPLSIEESIEWVGNSNEKAEWLTERWVKMGLVRKSYAPDPSMAAVTTYDWQEQMEAEIDDYSTFKKSVDARVAASTANLRQQVAELKAHVGTDQSARDNIISTIKELSERLDATDTNVATIEDRINSITEAVEFVASRAKVRGGDEKFRAGLRAVLNQ